MPHPSTATAVDPDPMSKVRRVRLGIRLAQPVHQRLQQYAAAKGRKPSAIVEAIVAEHLAAGGGRHTESSPKGPVDRLVEAMNAERAQRAEEHREVVRAVELLSLSVRQFQLFWILHSAPSVPPASDEARQREMQRARDTYRRLADHVEERYIAGRRFVQDFPKVGESGAAPRPGSAKEGR